MAGWEMKIIEAEARRLIALAAGDDDLRADLRALAQEILAATAGPTTTPIEDVPPADAGADVANQPGMAEEPPDARPQQPEPLHELTLGGRRPNAAATHPSDKATRPEPEDDLPAIEARCRSKSRAARRAAVRLRQTREATDVEADDPTTDPETAAWADRLTDSYYWLDAPDAGRSPDPSWLDDVGGCFEALAEGLSLAAGCRGRRGSFERSLPLLAEAQSMLRRALQRLRVADDPDQLAAYEWVREEAARRRVYLKRFLRADDLADPSGWPDLLDRIGTQAGGDPRARRQQARIDRLSGHLDAIRAGRGTAEDWRAVVGVVGEMVGDDVPPSDRGMRDLLLPVLDHLPDLGDLPAGFGLVLREIDRYLASRPSMAEDNDADVPTAEVAEVARLLRGKAMVVIGGSRRPESYDALRAAFDLKDLHWIETREHESIERFGPYVARPEVAVVLLAIRWSSHSFGEVKKFCDTHGKPMVRLPGGYGVNQVAAQILAQVSEQLKDD